MFIEFPMITSPWYASITFILYVFPILHLVDFYYASIIKIYPNNPLTVIVISDFITPTLFPIGYAINAILTVFILVSVFFNQNNY